MVTTPIPLGYQEHAWGSSGTSVVVPEPTALNVWNPPHLRSKCTATDFDGGFTSLHVHTHCVQRITVLDGLVCAILYGKKRRGRNKAQLTARCVLQLREGSDIRIPQGVYHRLYVYPDSVFVEEYVPVLCTALYPTVSTPDFADMGHIFTITRIDSGIEWSETDPMWERILREVGEIPTITVGATKEAGDDKD